METYKIGEELHRRFCLGEKLSDADKAHLDAWYAKMYEEEFALLGIGKPLINVEELKQKTAQIEVEIEAANKQVNELFQSNEELRLKNEALRKIIFEQLQLKRA